MDIASIKGQPRQLSGTRAARRLRKTGMVPGIMYGHGEEPQAVSVPLHELDLVLQHGTHLLELDLGGTPQRVLIKEVQYDHLGIEPLHVDLARVSLDERVSVTVPLVLRGDPKGVKEAGCSISRLSTSRLSVS
jgi:large subunit ribosomal protein L25